LKRHRARPIFNTMFQSHLDRSIAALEAVRSMENEVARAAHLMASCLHSGGRILSCGNGGSAAESAHFSTELLCRLDGDREEIRSRAVAAALRGLIDLL
jgi:D-sedoheptulose 7-phosphate isomerase